MTVDADGQILAAAAFGKYRLERGSVAGRFVSEQEVDAPEFALPDRSVYLKSPPPLLPLPASVMALRRDSAGYVWTVVRVADRNWRQGIRVTLVKHEQEQGWQVDELVESKYYDTRIDVIDLSR